MVLVSFIKLNHNARDRVLLEVINLLGESSPFGLNYLLDPFEGCILLLHEAKFANEIIY
jgi:hypothetical protein